MDKLFFGTGGTPHSTRSPSTASGIERIGELGLGCMEVEFVQGVRMNEKGAMLVAEIADKTGVKISVHAPYFINFNAHEIEKIKASQERLLQTARIASVCHAESVVFHTAFYLNDPPTEVYKTVKKHLKEVLDQLKYENNKVWIRPEVLGRGSQFGTIEEILNLCVELDGIAPCIDFAHWHARIGVFNSYPEFTSILEQVRKRLGRTALDNLHIHVSGIVYNPKRGEIKHLNLKESDFQYVEFLKSLKDYNVKGFVICESPNLEEDALLLQTTYSSLLKNNTKLPY